MGIDYEFYPTPATFTRYLIRELPSIYEGYVFEPCVGNGAIIEAIGMDPAGYTTNDLDPRWSANWNMDATDEALWLKTAKIGIDWTVTNPPFSLALDIAELAIKYSRVGVAMYLRASIHEVLKTGKRRTWFNEHPPTGILWLPRFAHQRSHTTAKWATDTVTSCWIIWEKPEDEDAPPVQQYIKYAPEWVLDELAAETPIYRANVDKLMEKYNAI